MPLHIDDNQQNYDQYNQAVDGGNHSSMGHEVIAGGAAFGAMKMFEDHQRKEGISQPILVSVGHGSVALIMNL